jgi:hypothetical protein
MEAPIRATPLVMPPRRVFTRSAARIVSAGLAFVRVVT